MKTIIYLKLVVLAFLYSVSLTGQNETYYIKSSRTLSPLIDKWIAEYSAINPNVKFQLADKKTKQEDITLSLISAEENAKDKNVLFFGKYVLLPIASDGNPILAELEKKRLNDKRLKELFFEKDILDEDIQESKPKYSATVYSGNSEVSFAQPFASHFGYSVSDFRGKKISGDDIFLINAIQNDHTGVTYNALANIFDLSTRKLKSKLAILPLDIKKEYREVLSSSSDIDRILNLLESETIDILPVKQIGFAYKSTDSAVKDFLLWIASEGRYHNHAYGILNIDQEVLTAQVDNVVRNFSSQLAQNK